MIQRVAFDYGAMAREAQQECEALRSRLALRKQHQPQGQEEALCWNRDNNVLYSIYLEQRNNQRLFARRAKSRGQL